MTRALLIRSIPLSLTTRNAWRATGSMFVRRSRDMDTIINITRGRPLINLGNNAFRPEREYRNTWNKADDVSVLLSPTASRDLFNEYLPSNEWQGDGMYWTKGAGRGGANKSLDYLVGDNNFDAYVGLQYDRGYDVQQNINGTEYRVITVSNRVVQVARRVGENGDRSYVWVGVGNAPRGIIPTAKWAAAKLLGNNVIGWDLIKDDVTNKVYILEGNACPGVNEATASRILNAIEVHNGL